MSAPVSRQRFAFLATLATGVAMLGASFHGMAGVEADLRAATAPQAPRATLAAHERKHPECPDRERGPRERPRGLSERV